MFNVDGGEIYRPTYGFSIDEYVEFKKDLGRQAMSQSLSLVLSLEVGSSGVRSAIVDINGTVVSSCLRPLDTIMGDDGAMVQDGDCIWDTVKLCVVESLKSKNICVDDIQGLICSGQYASVIPVAKNGEPVGPLYLYSDHRGSEHTADFYEKNPKAFQDHCDKHGRLVSGSGDDPLTSMLFVRESQPEIWAKTFCFLEPMDYVQARLTGRCVANQSSSHSWMMIDNREFNNSHYEPELLAFTSLDSEKLPELVPMGSVVGTVLPEIAVELGLSRATKVIAGATDTQTLAIATGAEKGGVGFSIGTTSVPILFADRIDPETKNLCPFDFEKGVLTMVGPIKTDFGFHLANVETGYAGKALEWVLKTFIFANDDLGDHSVEDMFSQLDLIAGSAEPGANGLIFFPWLDGSWMPGFDSNARGGFINMSLRTTRVEAVRAVMESIAYQLRWIYPSMKDFAGRDLDAICFCGGGARSDVWAQIIADVVGVPVKQLEQPELANCRGAAMLAFHNMGLIDLLSIPQWRQVKKVYQPRPEFQERYKVMGDAFIKAHEQLQPVHQMLADAGLVK